MSRADLERFLGLGKCTICGGDHRPRDCAGAIPDSDDPRRIVLSKLPLIVISVQVRGPCRVVAGHRAWLVDPGIVAEFRSGIEGWGATHQAHEVTKSIAEIAADKLREIEAARMRPAEPM